MARDHDVERLAAGQRLLRQPRQSPGYAPSAREGSPRPKRSGSTAAPRPPGPATRTGRCGLAHAAGLGGVDEDAQDPRLQRRAALEAVEPLQDAEPRLLDDLLGDARVFTYCRATASIVG